MPWICSTCQAEVDDGFGTCWQCGASSDGNPDPTFVREVDVATLPAGWVSRIQCQSCNYAGKVLVGHVGYRWWMIPLTMFASCTVVGSLPWFVVFFHLGNRTFKACPQCDARDGLVDWDGSGIEPTPEAEAIWKAKQEADDRAFAKNKLLLLVVALLMLMAALAYVFVTMSMTMQ